SMDFLITSISVSEKSPHSSGRTPPATVTIPSTADPSNSFLKAFVKSSYFVTSQWINTWFAFFSGSFTSTTYTLYPFLRSTSAIAVPIVPLPPVTIIFFIAVILPNNLVPGLKLSYHCSYYYCSNYQYYCKKHEQNHCPGICTG